jgi:hypothetical protein
MTQTSQPSKPMLSVPRPQRQGVLGHTKCEYSHCDWSRWPPRTSHRPRHPTCGSTRPRPPRWPRSGRTQDALAVPDKYQQLVKSLPKYASPPHGPIGPTRGPVPPRADGSLLVAPTVPAVRVHHGNIAPAFALPDFLILRPRPRRQDPLMLATHQNLAMKWNTT